MNRTVGKGEIVGLFGKEINHPEQSCAASILPVESSKTRLSIRSVDQSIVKVRGREMKCG